MVTTQTMNGKPVFEVPAKSVLNLESGFKHKLLCDGPTFTAGTACGFSCTFCYVPPMMEKSPHLDGVRAAGIKHHEAVIRRAGAIEALEKQLTSKGKPKFNDPNDRRVLYMSPLVDVAANQELASETVMACSMILKLTNWQIRLLSKSILIRNVATELEAFKDRLIFGLSTGTLDDGLAASFEQGTSTVSARIRALHWLQDNGFRTFGMICPSLPQADYHLFSRQMYDALRGDRCEHIWAECMNARGESFTRTVDAMRAAGYSTDAARFDLVTSDGTSWEDYSRRTFLAHSQVCRPGQLRFLQYVSKATRDWWKERESIGTVLL